MTEGLSQFHDILLAAIEDFEIAVNGQDAARDKFKMLTDKLQPILANISDIGPEDRDKISRYGLVTEQLETVKQQLEAVRQQLTTAEVMHGQTTTLISVIIINALLYETSHY
jgi:hypothetical protein